MKRFPSLRRQFLTALTLGAASTVGSVRAQEQCGCGFPKAEFEDYLQRFNNNDMSFVEFYHPDVVMELANTQLEGTEDIRDFYANTKRYLKETVDVVNYVSDDGGIAVETRAEFKIIKDWPNSFFGRDMKAGEVMRRSGIILYQLQNNKFKHIKAARFKLFNDWRME